MNREQFIKTVNEFIKDFGLDHDEFLSIGAGGSLLLSGLREETQDIDVTVRSSTFHFIAWKLLTKENTDFEIIYHGHPSGKPVIQYGDFEIHCDDEYAESNVWNTHSSGIITENLNAVLDRKLTLNRDKDQDDIENICKALNINRGHPMELGELISVYRYKDGEDPLKDILSNPKLNSTSDPIVVDGIYKSLIHRAQIQIDGYPNPHDDWDWSWAIVIIDTVNRVIRFEAVSDPGKAATLPQY